MATRHGNLTNDPLVFDQQQRSLRTNHYGEGNNLGKSKISTYNEVFTNPDSANRLSEQDVANSLYQGRLSLVTTTGENANPDFPNGTVTYNYNYVSRLNKIPFYRSGSIDTIDNLSGLSNKPNFTGEERNGNSDTSTLDNTGKFTPNLNVNYDNSTSGESYSNSNKNVPERSSKLGGFGSDTTIGNQTTSFREGDIHTNEETIGIVGNTSPQYIENGIAYGSLGQYDKITVSAYDENAAFNGEN